MYTQMVSAIAESYQINEAKLMKTPQVLVLAKIAASSRVGLFWSIKFVSSTDRGFIGAGKVQVISYEQARDLVERFLEHAEDFYLWGGSSDLKVSCPIVVRYSI